MDYARVDLAPTRRPAQSLLAEGAVRRLREQGRLRRLEETRAGAEEVMGETRDLLKDEPSSRGPVPL